jgi:site-specific recombinase XerD
MTVHTTPLAVTHDPALLATVHEALTQIGLNPAVLVALSQRRTDIPTLTEYLPRVRAAAGPGTLRTYGHYWDHMERHWGPLRLDDIAATDIEALHRTLAANGARRRNHRAGRHTSENLVAAARAIYNRAIADGLIDPTASPAHRVAKPRRLPSTRRALTSVELAEINTAARASGNDIALDTLLLRLHTETAARRGGALALRLVDLDVDRCLLLLREKAGTARWQPISPTLTTALLDHAACRGTVLHTDTLLRYRNGQPLTARRYDHLWERLGQELPWVAMHGISTHWLRHTTLTWVERHFGYGITRTYAGHTDTHGAATATYITADIHEVATALAALTGQPHPLADHDRLRPARHHRMQAVTPVPGGAERPFGSDVGVGTIMPMPPRPRTKPRSTADQAIG